MNPVRRRGACHERTGNVSRQSLPPHFKLGMTS